MGSVLPEGGILPLKGTVYVTDSGRTICYRCNDQSENQKSSSEKNDPNKWLLLTGHANEG
jgi:hypothetical protein